MRQIGCENSFCISHQKGTFRDMNCVRMKGNSDVIRQDKVGRLSGTYRMVKPKCRNGISVVACVKGFALDFASYTQVQKVRRRDVAEDHPMANSAFA